MRDTFWVRVISICAVVCAAVAITGSGRSVFSVCLGICVSFSIASFIAPLSQKLSKKTGIPRGLWAGAISLCIFLVSGAALVAVAIRLVRECGDMLLWLSDKRGEAGSALRISNIINKIPFLRNNEGARVYIEGVTTSFVSESASLIGKRMAKILGAVLHATPMAAISAFVFVMSTFYFSVDYCKICKVVGEALPQKLKKALRPIAKSLSAALKGYARAYFVIFLMTLCQVFVGLLILRVRFAFLIAVCVAAVDIFPVVGSGVILLPWAAAMIYFGNIRLGTGLIVLYGIVTVVRQIAEPKIVGDKLGIHPLASLLCMFFGMAVFGAFGAVIGPFFAVAVKELVFTKNANKN